MEETMRGQNLDAGGAMAHHTQEAVSIFADGSCPPIQWQPGWNVQASMKMMMNLLALTSIKKPGLQVVAVIPKRCGILKCYYRESSAWACAHDSNRMWVLIVVLVYYPAGHPFLWLRTDFMIEIHGI